MDYLKTCIQLDGFKCVTDALTIIFEYVSTTVIIIITCLLTLLYILLNRRQSAQVEESSSFVKLRFRKREKIWFYGRKMLRRVKLLARPNTMDQMNYIKAKVNRKKKMMVNLAGSLFRIKRQQESESWKSREPPSSLLEVDTQDTDQDHSLPSELIYMLRNVRVLGHFEKPIFLELCRYIESRNVPLGDYLFQVGDSDDAIYVVQSGRVLVHITEPDGKEFCVKEVTQGESVHSLLSVMDMLTGHPTPYRTVSAIATEDSSILRLPTAAFKKVLDQYPESLVRVIQIIMIRLQRVTFLALHNYLGLSQELINHDPPIEQSLLLHSYTSKPHVSPAHKSKGPFSLINHDSGIEQSQFLHSHFNKVHHSPTKKFSRSFSREECKFNNQTKAPIRNLTFGSLPQSSQLKSQQQQRQLPPLSHSKTHFQISKRRSQDAGRKHSITSFEATISPLHHDKSLSISSPSDSEHTFTANSTISEVMDEPIYNDDSFSTTTFESNLNNSSAANKNSKNIKRKNTKNISIPNNNKTTNNNDNNIDDDDQIASETMNNTIANILSMAIDNNNCNSISNNTQPTADSNVSDRLVKRGSLIKGFKLILDTNKKERVEPSDFITACTRARVEPKDLYEDKNDDHKRARSHSPVTSPFKPSTIQRSRKKSIDIKKLVSHMSRHLPKSQAPHPQSSPQHHYNKMSPTNYNYYQQHQPQQFTDAQHQQRQQQKNFLLQDYNQSFNTFSHEHRHSLQHTQQHTQQHTPLYNNNIDTGNYFYNPSLDGVTSSQLLDLAVQDLAKLLGLKDISLLKDKCMLRSVRANTMLVKQGDQDCSLYFMVSGWLKVLQQIVGKEAGNKTMYVVEPGELVGTLAVLTGEPSFFSMLAVTDVKFVHIAKNDFYILMKRQPSIVLNAGHTVVKRMSPFVRQIDFGLDWILIESGRALYRQSDKSDCVYIILNGRLRSVIQLESGKKELVGEYGRGELVGLVEVLTQTDRSTTMMAVRDTEIAQMPDEMLNLIKRKHPQVVTRLIHLLGQRILGSLGNQATGYGALSEQIDIESRCTVGNLATVAVMAVNDKVPLMPFTLELQHSLNAIGSTLRLNSEFVQSKLGKSAFDPVNEFRLSSWLGQQEDVHRMVLYECDAHMSPWTQRCIRQSDCILLVSLADQDPAVGKLEKQLESLSVRAQKELILLHKLEAPLIRNTLHWLNIRTWCSGHHHIRCPKRVLRKKPSSKTKDIYNNLFQQEPDYKSDFARLARFLTGTSIGVVLGGGGARGCSHVGVVKALTEAGIPIDIIGGTSIGSFMGALWAQETKYTPFKQRAREFARGMNALWKKIFDLTYPVTAMFTGSFLNKEVESVFQDCQIEDLWIPYFCITTDITASKMRVHTHGSLWRYVRASMSLSGYLPPLCDPNDGHLLLDGGYVNNLPADIMKVMGAQTIFAIDVGSQDETNLTNYGDELSGWWLLWKRFNPWAEQVKVPNMADIQSRLAYVSCNRQMEQVKKSNYCEYIRPPIDKYRNLQFGSYDEIAEVGYNHAKLLFTEWQKTDRIRNIFLETNEQNKPPSDKNTIPVNANFTDLAELISRIDEPDISPSSFIPSLNHWPDSLYNSDTEEDNGDNMSVTSEPIVSSLSPTIYPRIRSESEGATPESDLSQDDEDYEDEVLLSHRHHHHHRYLDKFEHEDF